ncbi:hypothetical protein JRO89_XS04G0250500 [Xanthoceras sorbifolium]|uniref:Uncharacterized protein n=1 Tax=Xanthoceras sorbifolium TaxID=99658 RepID=A0ABQ8I708_9ROSI|nr:hypothetical protein JRO89_XS04G0250500 [Xanthoceras sorbifolium]
MASTLLSTSSFLHSQNREVGGYVRNCKSSFYGKMISNHSFLRRETSSIRGGSVVVSSVLGRKVKNRETVIPDPDYRIPVVLLGTDQVFWFQLLLKCEDVDCMIANPIAQFTDLDVLDACLAGGLAYTNNLLPAAPVGLLGLLLLFQTTRVRFVFDDEALEVKVGNQLQESGENVFVGGKNRWKYSTFVNWELWWPNFPILVYFKETQTKPEGQVHFFPVIFNGKRLYDVMVERAGPSKTSGPKQS